MLKCPLPEKRALLASLAPALLLCLKALAIGDLVADGINPALYLHDTNTAFYDTQFEAKGVMLGITAWLGTSPTGYVAVDSDGALGVGVLAAVPYGGIGQAKLGLHGTHGTGEAVRGPYLQFTTDHDSYPLVSCYSFLHDQLSLNFDCYWDGSNYRSSDAGSNAQIVKEGDSLDFRYRGGRDVGFTVNAYDAIAIDLTNGSIKMPEVYSDVVSGNTRDLYIKSDGTLGYVGSSIRFKENVRAADPGSTDWIYLLRPVIFDYKAPMTGEDQCGLIAEEVADVNPDLVVYERELIYPEPAAGQPVEAEPQVRFTQVPETVVYSKLVVPMLAELRRLRSELSELRAEADSLKSGR